MMIKHFLAAGIMVAMTNGYCSAQVSGSDNKTPVAMEQLDSISDETQKFMEEAATGGMMEVQLGEMAQQKAGAQEVKDFGEMMVNDHSKANEELKSIAQGKSVTLPGQLTPKQQREVEKLSKLSGDKFDDEYMKMMVKDHEKDVEAFEKASQNLPDEAVQEFAAKTLPTLKEHLQKAEDINQQLRSS